MKTVNAVVDPKILFNRWFNNPISQLEKLDAGDGGTAGLMIVLPLYERYIFILRDEGKLSGKFYEAMASDLKLGSADEAETFWTTFRHGFCHAGMPFGKDRQGTTLPKVYFRGDFPSFPKFDVTSGETVILLDPWKFIHYVMDKYRADPTLLTRRVDAPLLGIYSVT